MKFVGEKEEAGANVVVNDASGNKSQSWYFEYSPFGKNANC